MRLSLNEATRLLLSGKQLAWSKYGTHKNGSIALDKPEQRRLLEFLLDADSSKVAEGSETLFEGLLDAWQNDDYDPGDRKSEEDGEHGTQSWLLDRVEASGFGGLTVFDGQPFDFYIGGSNWCLEGQNGSGKTSLASAILWALTGKYSRGHDGPMDVPDHREDVKDNDGKKIGIWPPLAAYPTQVSDLARKAEVWVRLTFKAQNGETATAYRCMISPPSGPTQNEQQIDDRLNTAVRVAEISVLMPARLAWIGFGKSSDSLYDAVKQLTGLDQLADIADGCSAFGNANRRFMKYAKAQYIDKYVERFNENTAVASQLAERFDIKIPDNITLAAENAGEIIRRAAEEASKAAGTHLVILKSEIPANVDTATVEGRSAVKAAVNAARGLVSQATKSITLFQTWRAMTDAAADEKFADLPGVSEAAKSQLAEGLVWHERQTADNKLRLKALAAQSFLAVKDGDSNCPLCGSLLDDDKKRPLAAELEELKAAASVAERTIGDVCRGIHETIDAAVPSQIREHRVAIDAMDPPVAYRSAMHDTFVAAAPFDDLLTGISAFAAATIEVQAEALPRFTYPAFSSAAEEPESVLKLRREIHALERLIGLIGWWKAHRHAFVAAWGQLIGNQGADGSFQDESIEAKLAVLERALDNAQPLDDISRHLSKAELAQREWAQINAMQEARKAVAEALSPLKAMRHLVAAETSRTIAELSGTIGIICDRIRLRERLSYEESVVERKQVNVTGSFSPGMRIDAALVANTSWSRAILWSFIFALREETLNAMGFNPLPLVVLDDPQGTFDPRNKRKWAEELVRCAKMPRSDLLTSQLILMTHERSFYQMVIAYEKLDAQQGLIGGVDKTSGVVTIANGGELERAYNEANDNNDDAKAREYIRKVRVYCEDLLKFMLRGEGNEVPDMNLQRLRDKLKDLSKQHIPPYDRKPFKDLANALNNDIKAVRYINDTHHKSDESYGVSEAADVNAYWDKTLINKIHNGFGVFDAFERHTGDPRVFPWGTNLIDFPEGHKAKVKAYHMHKTGIAAAAKTDGRVGDGVLTVREWDSAERLVLPNHSIYQLAVGTLEPVAGVGDVIVVSNYAEINPRNLVVAASGRTLLARRFNKPEDHPDIVVLTGQGVDPLKLPEPVIVQPDTSFRKIVGTLFAAHLLSIPPLDPDREFVEVSDPSILDRTLKGARLFMVEGRSAEPIALDGQYLITRDKPITADRINSLDGRLVVGIDEEGARYFKRLRLHSNIVVLESLNQDGLTSTEVLSLDGSNSFPRLTAALEVIGVLFDLPSAKGASIGV